MIIKDAKKVIFSLKGRINRLTYWAYSIPILALNVLVEFWDHGMVPILDNAVAAILILLLVLFSIWIGISLSVKRCHDRDLSGWWVLLLLVPIVGGIWALVSLGCMKGTTGDNRFGYDPFDEYSR